MFQVNFGYNDVADRVYAILRGTLPSLGCCAVWEHWTYLVSPREGDCS